MKVVRIAALVGILSVLSLALVAVWLGRDLRTDSIQTENDEYSMLVYNEAAASDDQSDSDGDTQFA